VTQATQHPRSRSLFAQYAYLPDGWQRDVLLRWDEHGTLTSVEAAACAEVDTPRAAGPIMPGMPNLHSHAFQRAMAGLAEYRGEGRDTFWSWRDSMYRFAARMTPETLEAVAAWLYVEMLRAGYTSVCEFHYLHHAPDGHRYAHPPELAERVVCAAADVGIGLTMLPVLYESSGFGGRAPRADQRRFISDPDALLGMLDSLRSAHPEDGTRTYGVAPHSLRAVSEPSLLALTQGIRARMPNAPIHIHIAEQTGEVDECLAATGARPVAWLLDHADVDARWCLVHATHLDDAETVALARSKAVVGLCPTTEANLGDGVFPARRYLDAQGPFGIGSDSQIAVDWRAELRLLEYGQRLARRERNVLGAVEGKQLGEQLVDAALAGGAQATGRPTGVLRAGSRADWLVLDPDHPSVDVRPTASWLSGIVFCEQGETPIRDVYVAGRCVVRERRHIDEARVYAAYRMAVAQLMR